MGVLPVVSVGLSPIISPKVRAVKAAVVEEAAEKFHGVVSCSESPNLDPQ